MIDQSVLNWIVGVAGALAGAVIKVMWDGLTDLQKTDRALIDRIAAIEVLVAGSYVKRDDFDRMISELFRKLERIENKLDAKVDK